VSLYQRTSKIGADFIASSVQEKNFFSVFSIASSLGKTFYLEICVAFSKEFKNWSRFYSFIGAGKLFFGFYYRFIGAGKLFFGFYYRFIGAGNFFLRFFLSLHR
jgi:hypothetical protein